MKSRLFALALTAVLTACQATPGAGVGSAPPASLRGLVTSGVDGAVASGARVWVEGAGFSGETTTGADGLFAVDVPPGATYDVIVEAPDGQGGLLKSVSVVEVVLPGVAVAPAAGLKLLPTGAVHGRVSLAGGGDAAGAEVFVPGTMLAAKVGPDGRFALDDMPQGTWTIVVQKPGYQRAAFQDVTVDAGEPTTLANVVTLAPGGSPRGFRAFVQDEAGRPVAGAELTAVDADGRAFATVSDALGAVTLTGLAAGDYRVQLAHAYYAMPARRTERLSADATTDLGTLTLHATDLHPGAIAGRVLDEAGKPVAGAAVRLDPSAVAPVVTDADGRFSFSAVAPGEYTVLAAHDGLESDDHDVTVENRVGAGASLAELTLRPLYDPDHPLAPERAVAKLLPPEMAIARQGDDLVVSWQPEGRPAGAASVVYDLQGEVAPGMFVYLGTSAGHTMTLKGFGTGPAVLRLAARTSDSPIAYRVASTVGGVGGGTVASITAADLQGMDLETAMMAVQANRANLLEAQLRSQIEGVQARNETIAKLNAQLSSTTATLTKLSLEQEEAERSLAAMPTKLTASERSALQLKVTNLQAQIDASTADVVGFKRQIDAMSNSQQMDMLRLQSLSNKRNEAFDIMTNFIKKMEANRSSIIGNMR